MHDGCEKVCKSHDMDALAGTYAGFQDLKPAVASRVSGRDYGFQY